MVERTNIKIPRKLYEEVKKFIKDTGFSSVTEFNRYLLRDVVAQGGFDEPEELAKDVEKIRERLKNLGYLK